MNLGKAIVMGVGLLWMGSGSGGIADIPEVDGAAVVTEAAGSPYGAIVARNAFRLKEPLPPPPPPTNAPPPPEQPKVDVKLAGLSEIRGVRFAYLMVPDADRPGQFQYPTLTDNPEQGRVRHGSGLEVREIDIKSQTVRLVNGGIEATLNFKDNGVKNVPAAAPAKPGQPGQPPRPTMTAAPASGLPGAANMAAASEAIVFSRNPNRASGGNMNLGGGAGMPASLLGQPSFRAGGAGVVVPTRPVRTTGGGGVATPGVVNPPQPQITLEQEYQALIRQRQVADQQGIQLPPIPGLPLPTDPGGLQ